MKKNFARFIVTSLATLAASTAFASTPDQDKAFTEAYKKAFESGDGAKLESFLYTKNADPEALEFYKMMMAGETGSKISTIELRALTPAEAKEASAEMPSPSGGTAKLPVAPSKKLVLKIETKNANGTSSSTSESFVAEVDGKLLIPVPVTVK